MKLNPMSPKLAAAILLATGASLTVSPAQAAEPAETVTSTPVVETIVNKYELSSFKSPVFEAPEVHSWAVAYTPSAPQNIATEPAAAALLSLDAQKAQQQKTVLEKEGEAERAEQKRIAEAKAKAAAEKAAKEKAAKEKAAKEKAAKEKAAKEKAAKEKAAREKAAAEKATKEAAAAQAAAAQAAAVSARQAEANSLVATGSSTVSGKSASSVTPTATTKLTGTDRERVVQVGYQNLGVPYLWGGNTQAGWDCSGFVRFALKEGMGHTSLPRTVNGMLYSDQLTQISKSQAKPGDLVIWSRGGNGYHVALYIGGNQIIHAPQPGQVTEVSPIWGSPTFHTLSK